MQLDRTQTITTFAALGLLFAGIFTVDAFADPDMFHEMALIRQAVELGHLPLHDDFAYTPTLSPIVHHEWGTGAVLYCLTRFAGPAGVFFWQHFSYFVFGGGPAIAGVAAWVWLMAEVYDLALARRRKVLLNDDDSTGIDKQPVATSG